MPNTRSAKKRLRQNQKRRLRNLWFRGRAKTFSKKALKAMAAGDVQNAIYYTRMAIKALDKAAAKGILHKNNVARRKSRLMRRLNALLQAQEAQGETPENVAA